jgi:hypothetical protein
MLISDAGKETSIMNSRDHDLDLWGAVNATDVCCLTDKTMTAVAFPIGLRIIGQGPPSHISKTVN